ncbi:MAG: peptidylprolyl isomerase [Nitrospirota bacterium]|nr:peptidylprolyl isomerase [Nitrospirota bacterium]
MKAKNGDIVKVHYVLSLKDGSVFDSSGEEQPFEFVIGKGMVISGIEDAVIGMSEGATKTVTILPEDAYGCYRDDLTHVVERSYLPLDIDPQVGMTIDVPAADGTFISALVTAVNDSTIKLDANHELAGEELIFEIRLLKVIRPG